MMRQSRFPQLGGEAVPRAVMSKDGTPSLNPRGNPKIALTFSLPDLGNPGARLAASANFLHSIETADPATVAEGMSWYPSVHEAVRKGTRSRGFLSGQSDKMMAGAGLVAAVSPNMDWDSNNIGAFDELRSLKGHQWDDILSGNPRYKDHVRGMSISSATVGNLQKAGRIIAGEDPHAVLDRRTAPKTNSFMHNIADPTDSRYATVDGRAFDTLTNRARPWEADRGIASAMTVRGAPTRYEQAEGIIKGVADQFGMNPSAAQAVSWVNVKYNIEQNNRTRRQGPARVGQPYFDPHTGENALFSDRRNR